MEEFMKQSTVPITKLALNYYEYGNEKIYMKYNRMTNEILVRKKDGTYIALADYVA